MKTVFKLKVSIINSITNSIILEGMMKEEYNSYEDAENNIEEMSILVLTEQSKNQIDKPKNICYMQIIKFTKHDLFSESKG